MPRIDSLTVKFMETFDKDELEPGVVYISLKYGCTKHLCCCGECGWETHMSIRSFEGDENTPQRQEDDTLWSNGWSCSVKDGKVTFGPSVGNFQFPCKSHYWIQDGKVVWC